MNCNHTYKEKVERNALLTYPVIKNVLKMKVIDTNVL